MATPLGSLTATVTGSIAFKADDTIDGNSLSFPGTFQKTLTLLFGSGLNAANLVYAARSVQINASATLSMDLDGTSLKTVFGDNVSFDKVKAIYIENASVNAATVIHVGGNAAEIPLFAATNDKLALKKGAFLLVGCGEATGLVEVTATTGDILSIVNTDGSNAALVNIAIIGDAT